MPLFVGASESYDTDAWEAYNLKTEHEKLRELCADLYAEMIEYSAAPHYNASVWAPKLRELGVKVD